MRRIDPRGRTRQRLDRLIGDLHRRCMATVDDLSTRRCPYKNRHDRCTAQFGCRNQRKPHGHGRAARLRRRRQARLPQGLGTTDLSRLGAGGGSRVTRTLFDDAQERRCGCRPRAGQRALPRVRRRGDRAAPSICAPPTARGGFLREPFRLACQAVVVDDGRGGRRSRSSAAACASRRPSDAGGGRPARSRGARRRRRRPLRRGAARAGARPASTASRSTSARRPWCSSSSTSRRPQPSRSSLWRTRSASAAATS